MNNKLEKKLITLSRSTSLSLSHFLHNLTFSALSLSHFCIKQTLKPILLAGETNFPAIKLRLRPDPICLRRPFPRRRKKCTRTSCRSWRSGAASTCRRTRAFGKVPITRRGSRRRWTSTARPSRALTTAPRSARPSTPPPRSRSTHSPTAVPHTPSPQRSSWVVRFRQCRFLVVLLLLSFLRTVVLFLLTVVNFVRVEIRVLKNAFC